MEVVVLEAKEVIELLGLEPHPEGGAFKETYRDSHTMQSFAGERSYSSAIYYLLKAGEQSHWHRLDADEIWHYYAGAPLELSISEDGVDNEKYLLGVDLKAGQRPQFCVPAEAWQSAKTLGDWTLVGCTEAPGFHYDSFELAGENWTPKNTGAD